MFQVLTLTVVIIAVAALTLFVVSVTRVVLDELDRRDERRMRREERPSVHEGADVWRQWVAYYRGLAEQARAEGNAGSATTYDSLAETYSTLVGLRLSPGLMTHRV